MPDDKKGWSRRIMRWLRSLKSSLTMPLIVAVVLMGCTGALVGLWYSMGFDLEMMSKLGGALGPLVGVLSLGAVVAALWSAHVQRKSLELQARGLEDQRQASVDEFRLQRNREMREAYARLFGALDDYHLAIREYVNKAILILQNVGAEEGIVDWNHEQRHVRAAYAGVRSSRHLVELLDADEGRIRHLEAAARLVFLDQDPQSIDAIISDENGPRRSLAFLRHSLRDELGLTETNDEE